ncbi:DDE-type integrase/transposase/recombinase [Microbacterium profundi]|uniref:DDE-type integrase/transposase/recombinase n=1 Tax=Microbacterium profundi TaxID=450380 RepID=UPI00126A3778|nr:DDE-type integrase/transposase/recombinase [Microbacterium profundi]
MLVSELIDDIELVGRVPYVARPEMTLRDAGITGEDARKAHVWHDLMCLLETGRDSRALPDDPINPEFDPELPKAIRVANGREYLLRRGIVVDADRTVYNKEAKWRADRSLISLVDGRKLGHPKAGERMPAMFREKLEVVLKAHWETPDISDKHLLHEARELVKGEDPDFELKHYSTQMAYLNIVKEQMHWRSSARGRQTASRRRGESFGVIRASRPGEFVHADTTKLACYMLDEDNQRVRYELSILLDVYSTAVLSFALARTTTAKTIVRMLARASFPASVRPYGRAIAELMESTASEHEGLAALVTAWDPDTDPAPFVAIETLVVDNGLPYIAHLTHDVAEALGCGMRYSRAYSPEDKATVEKALKDIEQRLLQIMPGFTGGSVEHRGTIPDSDLLPHVVMVQLLQDFFDAVWANTQSRGLWDSLARDEILTPNQVLLTATAIAPSLPVPDIAENYIRLLRSDFRIVQHYGIDHAKMVFDSDDLLMFHGQPSGDAKHGQKYLVKWDPDYPTALWVMNPRSKNWILVPWKRIGDYQRPFARELLRGAGAKNEDVVSDDVLATKEIVARFDRYRTPASPKPKKRKAAASSKRAPARQPTPRMSAGPEGIRLMRHDEEIDL